MNDFLSTRPSVVAALGLGAVGIALLWAGGVDFPVAVPPGMVILLAGAAVVALFRRPWTGWIAAGLGLFIVVGFVLSGINGEGSTISWDATGSSSPWARQCSWSACSSPWSAASPSRDASDR